MRGLFEVEGACQAATVFLREGAGEEILPQSYKVLSDSHLSISPSNTYTPSTDQLIEVYFLLCFPDARYCLLETCLSSFFSLLSLNERGISTSHME